MMRATIDSAACTGHGICYGLAPAVFGDDDQGFGHVIGDGTVAEGKEDTAADAVANCPERAITIS